jgi:ribonuclease Z
MKESHIQRIIAHHTTPRDAGRVFFHTRPKLAAYTHIVQLGNYRFAAPTIERIVSETRETYDSPLVVGEDLMSFEIGETVTVLPHAPTAMLKPVGDG